MKEERREGMNRYKNIIVGAAIVIFGVPIVMLWFKWIEVAAKWIGVVP